MGFTPTRETKAKIIKEDNISLNRKYYQKGNITEIRSYIEII